MVLATTNFNDYMLSLPCIICEGGHHISLKRQELWNTPVYRIKCSEHDIAIGYIGGENDISAIIAEGIDNPESIINDEGFGDYFQAPEIMYKIMEKLHDISEHGNLYCACGQKDIDVEVFPDRLELLCPACHGLTIVYAENIEDLQAIMETGIIELTEKGFTSIDSSAFRQRNKKKMDRTDNA